MIGMPTTPVRLTIGEARALGERALRAIGYTAQDSASIADHLIDCELRGLEYSGLARIPSIDERLSAVGSLRSGNSGCMPTHVNSPRLLTRRPGQQGLGT